MLEEERSSMSSVDLLRNSSTGGDQVLPAQSTSSDRNDSKTTDANPEREQKNTGCFEKLWRCLMCKKHDSVEGDKSKYPRKHYSVEGMSLPDLSMDFTDDFNGELAFSESLHSNPERGDDKSVNEENEPVELSPALDKEIEEYERSLAAYKDLEENVLDGIGSELASVLQELRRDPESFSMSTNPHIQALARRRVSVFSTRARLGIKGDIADGDSRKRSKSFSASDSSPDYSIFESSASPVEPDLGPSMLRPKMFKRASWQVGTASNGIGNTFSNKKALVPGSAIVSSSEHRANSKPSDNLFETHGDGNAPGATGSEKSCSLSTKLSTRWAERLIEVNPTRGKLKEDGVDKDGLQTFKIRPLWPEWLVDMSYTVTKRNKYGKRQKRIIRLTQYHFYNVKNGNIITQTFPYSEMKNVWLKNQTTLVVSFGDDRIYEYQSEIAPLIAQQLATRAQVRMALDKVNSNIVVGRASVANYSRSTAAIISSITSSKPIEGTSSIISFARTISEAFLNDRECTNRGSSMWHRDKDGFVDDVKLAVRLIHIVPESPEMIISAAVQDILFDVSCPEGNTRRLFIEKFLASNTQDGESADWKSLTTQFRHFIDGMHEYIMEKRGASLAAIFVVASSGEDKRKLGFKVAKAHDTDHGPEVAGRSSDGVYQHPAIDPTGAPWWRNHDELTIITLSYLVFSGVEQSMFIALQGKISESLPAASNKEEDKQLYKRIRYLRNRSQEEWDIPEAFQSQLNWESATFELAGIERNPSPSMKMYALLQCAKAIYTEFQDEVLVRFLEHHPEKTDVVLGADDFLPIFIYVLCHSDIHTPVLTKELLWNLCHPDQLYGESGYYLTAYESALEYIQNLQLDMGGIDDDEFEADSVRRTITVLKADEEEFKAIMSPTNQIKKKIRRMSTSVIERVKTRNASIDSGSSTDRRISSDELKNERSQIVSNPLVSTSQSQRAPSSDNNPR